MRRLIILAVEEGKDPEIEWEGPFAYYEILAALERAQILIEEQQFIEEVGEASGEDGEEE